MTEREFFERAEKAGGTAYLVGGAVRDPLMGRAAHDRDYVICGVSADAVRETFPDARRTGKTFPVYIIRIDGKSCEVALARREKKSGAGYCGFDVTCSPEITIEEDLYRRDTSVNSMARDADGKLIDPYGGAEDIKRRVIRATSRHFCEDPVRALRAARQAAQFGFAIEKNTLEMMRLCADELRHEPRERKFAELEKAMGAQRPSIYFRALLAAGLLEQEFPHIYALIGKTQLPEHHPEGDAFEHTMMAVDKAAAMTERREVRFAALMHDIGKGQTPDELLPRHDGHAERGAELIKEISAEMRLPRLWSRCAEFAAREHMRPSKMRSPEKVRDLIRALEREPIGPDGFAAVVAADNNGEIPAFIPEWDRLRAILRTVSKCAVPQELKGPAIGAYIRAKEIEAIADAMK